MSMLERGWLVSCPPRARHDISLALHVRFHDVRRNMASPGKEKVVDIQASATVDWSPLGDIYVK